MADFLRHQEEITSSLTSFKEIQLMVKNLETRKKKKENLVLDRYSDKFYSWLQTLPGWLLKNETDKLMLKVVWKCKEPGIAKTILRRNNGDGGLILLDFKTYQKATVNQDDMF